MIEESGMKMEMEIANNGIILRDIEGVFVYDKIEKALAHIEIEFLAHQWGEGILSDEDFEARREQLIKINPDLERMDT